MIIFGIVSLIATVFAISLTACSDPGIVKKCKGDEVSEVDEEGKTRRVCKSCNIVRKHKQHHCRQCGCCVEDLDHHCPWTGKCIGRRTIKYFYTFLTGIVVLIV